VVHITPLELTSPSLTNLPRAPQQTLRPRHKRSAATPKQVPHHPGGRHSRYRDSPSQRYTQPRTNLSTSTRGTPTFVDRALEHGTRVRLQRAPVYRPRHVRDTALSSSAGFSRLAAERRFPAQFEMADGHRCAPFAQASRRYAGGGKDVESQSSAQTSLRPPDVARPGLFGRLDAVFEPKIDAFVQRKTLVAQVLQMLVRRGHGLYGREYLLLVLKNGTGPNKTQAERRALVRSFGFESGADRYISLAFRRPSRDIGLKFEVVEGAQRRRGRPIPRVAIGGAPAAIPSPIAGLVMNFVPPQI
jgi:hypothetical protein